jgi:hypothetical protein
VPCGWWVRKVRLGGTLLPCDPNFFLFIGGTGRARLFLSALNRIFSLYRDHQFIIDSFDSTVPRKIFL